MDAVPGCFGVRRQGVPNETITIKRYDTLQRFAEGVRDPTLLGS